jgi:hypothetical protein
MQFLQPKVLEKSRVLGSEVLVLFSEALLVDLVSVGVQCGSRVAAHVFAGVLAFCTCAQLRLPVALAAP